LYFFHALSCVAAIFFSKIHEKKQKKLLKITRLSLEKNAQISNLNTISTVPFVALDGNPSLPHHRYKFKTGAPVSLIAKQFFSLIKLLNSETGENQIAAGIAAGFILGMTPALSLQSVLVFLCLFFFRIQIGMAFLAAFFFAFVAWILDPAFHWIGLTILQIESLQGVFTTLYNMPILPFTRFNNTIVMGSGLVALALSPLIFFVSKKLVIQYRESVLEKIKQTKMWKVIKATSLYKWYYSYENLYGK
jgi:uncharacterized protein (TIGR03546 family)